MKLRTLFMLAIILAAPVSAFLDFDKKLFIIEDTPVTSSTSQLHSWLDITIISGDNATTSITAVEDDIYTKDIR